jgi:hypothetical protein
MTEYELPKETMDRYFADSRRVTNIAVTMAADQLTKDLIGVFERKHLLFLTMEQYEKADGVKHCINHLKDFMKT